MTKDKRLEDVLSGFPDSDRNRQTDPDYDFYDRFQEVLHPLEDEFDEILQDNHPDDEYGREDKSRAKKKIEANATRIVDVMNAASRSLEERFNLILSATAGVDDFLSQDSLKKGAADLPEFDSDFLESEQEPEPLRLRDKPTLRLPEENAFSKLPFFSSMHRKKTEAAQADFDADLAKWEEERTSLPDRQKKSLEEWIDRESSRKDALKASQEAYKAAVDAWEASVSKHNEDVEKMFTDAAKGDKEAVERYFSLVFEKASYPREFRPKVRIEFLPEARELVVELALPHPDVLNKLVTFKYQKGSLSIEQQVPTAARKKKLFSSLVAQLVVRVAHELAEADRGEIARAIAVKASMRDVDPLEGKSIDVLVAQLVTTSERLRALQVDGLDGAAALKSLKGEISSSTIDKVKLAPKGAIGRA